MKLVMIVEIKAPSMQFSCNYSNVHTNEALDSLEQLMTLSFPQVQTTRNISSLNQKVQLQHTTKYRELPLLLVKQA